MLPLIGLLALVLLVALLVRPPPPTGRAHRRAHIERLYRRAARQREP